MKKLNKKKKKILLSVTALVLVAAIGLGIWFGTQNSGDPIHVYAFNDVGMTEYWGDSQESYGPVTTDRIQTVFLTDTQVVTEVKVKEGDTVKKGDILLSFDTTLSDLQLERKRLEVEKQKLQLDALNTELRKIQSMKPMTPMDDIDFDFPEPSLGTELLEPYAAYVAGEHDGKSMGGAFVCRLRGDTVIDDTLLEALRIQVWGKAGFCEHDVWEETCEICHPPICIHGQIQEECPVCALEVCEHGNVAVLCPKCVCEHGYQRGSCPICSPDMCEHGHVWADCPICNPPDPPVPDETDPEETEPKETEPKETEPKETDPIPTESQPPVTDPAAESAGTVEGLSFSSDSGYFFQFLADDVPSVKPAMSYYVVFKITEGNMDLGANTLWQGVYIYGQGSDFSLSFFTPTIEDYTLPEEEPPEISAPSIDFGSGYTAAEIAKMRKEQEKKIKEQDLKTKMAEAEYKIMQRELNDGNIYADFDGKVVSLLTEEESRQQEQPMLKVSGGGGFYITGSVSELEKENLQIGQEVTINDWRSGGMYTGAVESIGDFPSSTDSWNGIGNPTATYYPFTVFVDGEANLQSGNYVSVQYSTSGSTNGIYLVKAFIRTEKGESYVFVQGEDGRLEKRTVVTGKSLWGSYLEILSGVTVDDKLAFPYGKDVKEGAKTVDGDMSDLYGY